MWIGLYSTYCHNKHVSADTFIHNVCSTNTLKSETLKVKSKITHICKMKKYMYWYFVTLKSEENKH